MTNKEKLREVFPNTIFIFRKDDEGINAIMCSDEWLDSEYTAPQGEERNGIKALEKEPREDAISRQTIIDMTGLSNWFESSDDYNDFVEAVCALPPVTPIRPKGEWKYDKTVQNWRCSKCNETPKTLGYVGTKEFMTEHFKFCNHCGVDMRGKT